MIVRSWTDVVSNSTSSRLTLKTLAVHLVFGYNCSDVAKMFESRYREGHVSKPTVYNMRNRIQKEINI